jgi:hypothetical protein
LFPNSWPHSTPTRLPRKPRKTLSQNQHNNHNKPTKPNNRDWAPLFWQGDFSESATPENRTEILHSPWQALSLAGTLLGRHSPWTIPRGRTARRSVPTSEVIGLHSAVQGTTVYPWMRGKIPRLKTGKTAGGRDDFQPRCLIEEQAPRLPPQKAELQQPGYVWMLLVLAIES